MRTSCFALGLWLLAGMPARLGAQERAPYVGASALLSSQGSERPGSSPSFPTSGVGGTALGLSLEAGGFLSSRLSIAFEASIPARFESIQETDYFVEFQTANRHRDLVLSGLFHAHLAAAGPLRIAIVGGPSVIREDTLQRTAYRPRLPPNPSGPFGPFGDETPLLRWTVGVTGGADAAIRIGDHVSVVPEFRLHWINRAEEGEGGSGFLGLSAWVWRPAVGVRATF